jgi:predicted branched-subunit amino acid permease
MAPTKQPDLNPSERSSELREFVDTRAAFWFGVKNGLGAPAMVLFAGMIGFGAMVKTAGLDGWFAVASSLLMFALPGQVLLLEMVITGSPIVAIILASTLTSARFITMTVTLFPQLHAQDRNRKLYASVHLVAMTAWAVSMREFNVLDVKHRASYFLGLGLVCWLAAIPGTYLGYLLAGSVPVSVTLGLIFINPLFFLLTFTEVKPWINRIAIFLGCVFGPIFYLLDRDSSLLAAGLLAGTIAYLFDRKVLRKKPGVIG